MGQKGGLQVDALRLRLTARRGHRKNIVYYYPAYTWCMGPDYWVV